MRISTYVLLAVVSSFFSAHVADAAFFDLLGTQGGDVDGLVTGMTTVDGITATLTASGPVGAVLNTSGTNFGINGTSSESTAIDDDDVAELLTITFSEPVFFQSFTVDSTSGATVVAYAAGSFSSTFDFPSGGPTSLVELPGSGVLVSAVESVTFSEDPTSGASGFSLDSFTVSAIPEPASLGLVMVGAGLMLGRRKRA